MTTEKDHHYSKYHEEAMTWTCFLYYWPFVRGIHQSPAHFPHKGSIIWSFHVFFVVVGLRIQLNTQSDCQWFKMQWDSFMWHHCHKTCHHAEEIPWNVPLHYCGIFSCGIKIFYTCKTIHHFIANKLFHTLTHWGLDKMDAILQTTFSTAFLWMKMLEFWLKFH